MSKKIHTTDTCPSNCSESVGVFLQYLLDLPFPRKVNVYWVPHSKRLLIGLLISSTIYFWQINTKISAQEGIFWVTSFLIGILSRNISFCWPNFPLGGGQESRNTTFNIQDLNSALTQKRHSSCSPFPWDVRVCILQVVTDCLFGGFVLWFRNINTASEFYFTIHLLICHGWEGRLSYLLF